MSVKYKLILAFFGMAIFVVILGGYVVHTHYNIKFDIAQVSLGKNEFEGLAEVNYYLQRIENLVINSWFRVKKTNNNKLLRQEIATERLAIENHIFLLRDAVSKWEDAIRGGIAISREGEEVTKEKTELANFLILKGKIDQFLRWVETITRHPDPYANPIVVLKNEINPLVHAIRVIMLSLQEDTKQYITRQIDTVTKATEKSAHVSIILTLMALMAAIGIGYYMAMTIAKPLKTLEQAATQIGDGQFDTPIEITTKDEMGRLGAAFNRMAHEIKEKNTTLFRSKECVENIMVSMTDTLIVFSPKGVVEKVNRYDLIGYSEDDLNGFSVSDLFPQQPILAIFTDSTHQAAGPLNFIGNTETTLRTKDGRDLPVLVSGSVMRDVANNVSGIVMVAKDISDYKKSAQKLHEQEVQLAHAQYISAVKEREAGSRMTISRLLETALAPMSLTQQLETLLDIIFSVPWFALNQKGGIFLLNPETGDLELKAHRGFSPSVLAMCSRVPMGKCLCGQAAQMGQTIFASHVNEQHEVHYDRMVDHGHYCVPIKIGNRVTGVINLYVNTNHTRIAEEDDFLDSVAVTMSGLVERKKLEEQVKHHAEIDNLTGLPNRALFQDRLARVISHANRTKTEIVLMLLDLDKFKIINSTQGHQAGDKLLQDATQRILACVRDTDTVARLGGDQFTIILPKLTHVFYVEFVAMRILEELSKPFSLPEGEVDVTASIGITLFPRDAMDMEQLLRNANAAMHHAKKSDWATFRFFEAAMTDKAMERLDIEKGLRLALANDEFLVFYQPKVDPQSNITVSMEALVRWNKPHVGLIPPEKFIAIAEQTGLIVPLGARVLEIACRQNKTWIDAGFPPMCVSVNLSPRQFRHGDQLITTIKEILAKTRLPPAYLELEITESIMMEDMNKAVDIMKQIKALGIQISVDDFGTGYSSLSSLKTLPIQTLKIDRSFITGLIEDKDSVAIVFAIIFLAKQLNLKIVAEGVETAAQVDFLRQHGCDEIQGFYYAKPLSAEAFAVFLGQNRS